MKNKDIYSHLEDLYSRMNNAYAKMEYYRELDTIEALKWGMVASAYNFSFDFICEKSLIDKKRFDKNNPPLLNPPPVQNENK